MPLTNRERQALYRRRARKAKDGTAMLQTAVEEAIQLTEEAIAIEKDRGTRPDDGTAAGAMMLEQERWIAFQREQLSNLVRDTD